MMQISDFLLVISVAGRVIAQAFSRRLPNAAVRVRSRVRLCGIYGGQNGTGASFLTTSVFLANSHSTDCSIIIIIIIIMIIWGW
jgi:hypothetical protein